MIYRLSLIFPLLRSNRADFRVNIVGPATDLSTSLHPAASMDHALLYWRACKCPSCAGLSSAELEYPVLRSPMLFGAIPGLALSFAATISEAASSSVGGPPATGSRVYLGAPSCGEFGQSLVPASTECRASRHCDYPWEDRDLCPHASCIPSDSWLLVTGGPRRSGSWQDIGPLLPTSWAVAWDCSLVLAFPTLRDDSRPQPQSPFRRHRHGRAGQSVPLADAASRVPPLSRGSWPGP